MRLKLKATDLTSKTIAHQSILYALIAILFLASFGISWLLALFESIALLAMVIGSISGAIAAKLWSLETVFVGGNIALMLMLFFVAAATIWLPVTWIESLSIFLGIGIVGAAYGAIAYWLINKRIRQYFGISKAVAISALAIASGIIVEHLLIL